ncbi:hypothetical protein [Streptomyces harbinensis]|uniref:hypothetical protein n=1 Tax=Streptomyces harbinensis TaxID=1176198 RepID=UPI0034DF11D4
MSENAVVQEEPAPGTAPGRSPVRAYLTYDGCVMAAVLREASDVLAAHPCIVPVPATGGRPADTDSPDWHLHIEFVHKPEMCAPEPHQLPGPRNEAESDETPAEPWVLSPPRFAALAEQQKVAALFFSDASLREAARVLNVSVTTVRNRWAKLETLHGPRYKPVN